MRYCVVNKETGGHLWILVEMFQRFLLTTPSIKIRSNMTTASSDYKSWDVNETVEWIISIDSTRFAKYRQRLINAFKENGISGININDFDREDFKDFGIINLDDRKTIYKEIIILIAAQKRRGSQISAGDSRCYMEMTKDATTSDKLVSGFLNDLNKMYKVCARIPQNVYGTLKLFYDINIARYDTDEDLFMIGNKLLTARDKWGKWYKAEIIDYNIFNDSILIHYIGWDSKWDEWINIKRKGIICDCDAKKSCVISTHRLKINGESRDNIFIKQSSSPFIVLFKIYDAMHSLKVQGWDQCDIKKQCKYLQLENKRDNSIDLLLENEYNFDLIPCQLKTNITTEVEQICKMYCKEVTNILEDDIREWNHKQILLSFINHIINETNKQSGNDQKEQQKLWRFVDFFRKYLFDPEVKSKWNGYVLLDAITFFGKSRIKNNESFSDDIRRLIQYPQIISQHSLIINLMDSWQIELYTKYGHTTSTNISPHNSDLQIIVSAGQQFIYDEMNGNEDRILNQNSLLVSGYCQQHEIRLSKFIPSDIKRTIEQFYGKTYHVLRGEPPAEDEYDYAVEFLSPMELIGIYYDKEQTKITGVCTNFARRNIVVGSEILQIGECYYKDTELLIEDKDKLWKNLKKVGSSYVILRSKKQKEKKGTHLIFDITPHMDSQKETFKFFPIYKFKPETILKAAKVKFIKNLKLFAKHAYSHLRRFVL